LIILLSLFSYSGIRNAIDAEAVCVQIIEDDNNSRRGSDRQSINDALDAEAAVLENNSSGKCLNLQIVCFYISK